MPTGVKFMLKTALIFAAGRGERLNPLTLHTPKPLIKIAEQPLIFYHLQKLILARFDRVIINHAYLGYQIKQYALQQFGNQIQIDFFPEPSGGLETGGTLAALCQLGLIKNEFLFTINADVFTDFSFDIDIEIAPNYDGKLFLIPANNNYPEKNFSLTSNQIIGCENPEYIFSGLAIYRVEALSQLRLGRYSIRQWLFDNAKKHKLQGQVYHGLWQDIGSLQRLNQIKKVIR
jgi:MurNAc alpha-1-phosphate uridylyltransferase